MASPRYETALIVGAGAGLSASLARLFSREGIRVALAARNIDKLADLVQGDGRAGFRLRRDRLGSGGEPVRGGRTPDRRSGRRRFQRQRQDARPLRRTRPRGGRTLADRERLRRLPGGAAGRAPDGPEGAWRDPVYRRLGERQGIRPISPVRDGQVRPSRTRAEHGSRTRPAGDSRRPFRDRRRHSKSGSIRVPGQAGTRCSTPTRSRRPICTC